MLDSEKIKGSTSFIIKNSPLNLKNANEDIQVSDNDSYTFSYTSSIKIDLDSHEGEIAEDISHEQKESEISDKPLKIVRQKTNLK